MKSYIHTLADYRLAPVEWEVIISCPREHLEKEVRHVVRPYKCTQEVSVIEKGDVALLKLDSTLPKFSKKAIPVTIGSGLLDAELEAQIPGHAVNETFCAKAQGVSVAVTILKCSRTIFPEPTDEMVAQYSAEHEEYAGIRTVQALCNKIVEDYCAEKRQAAVYNAMQEIIDYVLTHSDWEFDETELRHLNEATIEYERQRLLRDEGKDLNSISDQEIMRYFGIQNRERLIQLLSSGNEQRIAIALWSAVCCGRDPALCTLEDAEHLDFEFLEAYVRENLTFKEER